MTEITKALSLRQPWAWMVVLGAKDIENRQWRTHHRGPVYIHAAKGMTALEYSNAVAFAAVAAPSLVVPPMADLRRGGIIGSVTIVDVVPPCRALLDGEKPPWLQVPCEHPWHIPWQYGFRLTEPRTLTFRPLLGALGIFKVPPADGERTT